MYTTWLSEELHAQTLVLGVLDPMLSNLPTLARTN